MYGSRITEVDFADFEHLPYSDSGTSGTKYPGFSSPDMWKSVEPARPVAASLEQVKATLGPRQYRHIVHLIHRWANACTDDAKQAAVAGLKQIFVHYPSLFTGICVFEPIIVASPAHAKPLAASIMSFLVGGLPSPPPPLPPLPPPSQPTAWERESLALAMPLFK